jgi:predicted alpha/beta superfamily hydrolase
MNKFTFLISVLLFSCQLNAQASISKIQQPVEITPYEAFTINSAVLGRTYNLSIKLPLDYLDKGNETKKYPVLYLNDAPHTFKVAAGVTYFNSMDKAIVVGISYALGVDGQFSRFRDLTPEYDKSVKQYTTGQAPEFLKFIEDEVITFVEKNYRADPTKRMLSAHSLGASFGAWVLLTKPEVFSSYILTSPSLWFKNELIFSLEEKYAAQHKALKADVFIATGALETPEHGMNYNMVDGHQRFLTRLRSRNYQGLRINDEIVSGTDHFPTFPVSLEKGLRWIYQDL